MYKGVVMLIGSIRKRVWIACLILVLIVGVVLIRKTRVITSDNKWTPERVATAEARAFLTAVCAYIYVTETEPLPETILEDLKGTFISVDGYNQLLSDPWGNKYSLLIQREFVQVISMGSDGMLGTKDDICETETLEGSGDQSASISLP
jgi:hypothetical protein